jgi:hypothetical protein
MRDLSIPFSSSWPSAYRTVRCGSSVDSATNLARVGNGKKPLSTTTDETAV